MYVQLTCPEVFCLSQPTISTCRVTGNTFITLTWISFPNGSIGWFKSYLSDRWHYVRLNGVQSRQQSSGC